MGARLALIAALAISLSVLGTSVANAATEKETFG